MENLMPAKWTLFAQRPLTLHSQMAAAHPQDRPPPPSHAISMQTISAPRFVRSNRPSRPMTALTWWPSALNASSYLTIWWTSLMRARRWDLEGARFQRNQLRGRGRASEAGRDHLAISMRVLSSLETQCLQRRGFCSCVTSAPLKEESSLMRFNELRQPCCHALVGSSSLRVLPHRAHPHSSRWRYR